jgi:hypothetical protein
MGHPIETRFGMAASRIRHLAVRGRPVNGLPPLDDGIGQRTESGTICGWNIDDVQIFGVDISVQTPCPWDTTGNGDQPDGSVGTADFFALLQNWGSCPVGDCPWDTTGDNDEPDGAVGVDDFFALLQHWGPCPQ